MATKRSASEASNSSGSGQPPSKKLLTQFEPIKIGPISTLVSLVINLK